ncbi:hypothetical protein CcrColossus_gp364 [Caulobacter phage CcrColossus]|uniref:Uncharacterized protein n=1 Tax=Caulobacter phage CcrColossus TaxID=1211640 RepID=K4JSA6_9CAUD|nr:hypothetical protein CcrColossus_gp364 [Caulobacter phage CcrColossus]AFU88234.1 hypothetical protein CcrColossus_gp364 [Caulobacter phage CcrColossus]
MKLAINITLAPGDALDVRLVKDGAVLAFNGVEVRMDHDHVHALLQGLGKRRVRRDRLSLSEKVQRRAQAPASQATLGALEGLQERHGWVFVHQLVEVLGYNPDKVRASLHALKHAGLAESKVSEIKPAGSPQPLVMYRTVEPPPPAV